MKTTYPPRASRVGKMDSGCTPQQWEKGRSSAWRCGIKLSRRTSPSCQQENPRTPRDHSSSRRVLLRTEQANGATYVMKMSLFQFQSWAAPPNTHFHRSTSPGRPFQTENFLKTVDSWNKNLVGNQSLFEDSHWVLKIPWEVQTRYLMDNHLRIERKENLRIERKEKTRGSTFQTHKEAKMATKSAKAAKTVLKTRQAQRGLQITQKQKNKNNTSTKDDCKHCKKISTWHQLRKCWSLLANAKERPNKGKWKQ